MFLCMTRACVYGTRACLQVTVPEMQRSNLTSMVLQVWGGFFQ
jgi:hypothetical protein